MNELPQRSARITGALGVRLRDGVLQQLAQLLVLGPQPVDLGPQFARGPRILRDDALDTEARGGNREQRAHPECLPGTTGYGHRLLQDVLSLQDHLTPPIEFGWTLEHERGLRAANRLAIAARQREHRAHVTRRVAARGGVVGEQFVAETQPRAQPPEQRLPAQDRPQQRLERAPARVAGADVRELVPQHEPRGRGRPGQLGRHDDVPSQDPDAERSHRAIRDPEPRAARQGRVERFDQRRGRASATGQQTAQSPPAETRVQCHEATADQECDREPFGNVERGAPALFGGRDRDRRGRRRTRWGSRLG